MYKGVLIRNMLTKRSCLMTAAPIHTSGKRLPSNDNERLAHLRDAHGGLPQTSRNTNK
jgi:hypothetical protein